MREFLPYEVSMKDEIVPRAVLSTTSNIFSVVLDTRSALSSNRIVIIKAAPCMNLA